jgi:ubiquinol-cytochrome c reductase cytochrome c subunit
VVHPELGSISRGAELFGSSCAGCHSITGEGGVVVGGFAPELHKASPTEVAEAVRVGPYLMPSFDRNQVSDADLNSIARYVDQAIQQPDDRGGWGIGHLGPVPEGLIAWVIAAAALLLIARMIGERSSGDPPEEDS